MTLEQRIQIMCRFAAKVHFTDGCWTWTAQRLPDGYGRFQRGKRRSQLAHRASYELFCGKIPTGMCVCHRCDNPSCVRPSHLFLGTQADNVRDCTTKGRRAPMPRARPEHLPRGERHARARLTEALVRQIRKRVAAGETQTAVGRDLSIAQGTISNIVRRKLWAHVTPDEA